VTGPCIPDTHLLGDFRCQLRSSSHKDKRGGWVLLSREWNARISRWNVAALRTVVLPVRRISTKSSASPRRVGRPMSPMSRQLKSVRAAASVSTIFWRETSRSCFSLKDGSKQSRPSRKDSFDYRSKAGGIRGGVVEQASSCPSCSSPVRRALATTRSGTLALGS